MSATNRGGDRDPNDNYPTPPWVTERLLRHVPIPTGWWLDPGAGEGLLIRSVKAFRPDVSTAAVELRGECAPQLATLCGEHVNIGDFFGFQNLGPYNAVVTNPPYGLAQKFITHSLPLAPWVVMLLRLNFFGSGRYDFFKDNMPDVYVLSNRPSFKKNKNGKTGSDATEYAWFVWTPERGRTTGKVTVLPGQTIQERRAIDSWVRGGASR